MSNKKSSLHRTFGVLTLACLALTLVMGLGGSQGITPANAAAPATQNPQARSQNPTEVLVTRVYFKDAAERDRLATELGADEVPTTGGYLTVFMGWAVYNSLLSRHIRVEIDEAQTRRANEPGVNTFYGGYKTVEEMETFLDQKVAAYPSLAEKIDIGDSWCKTHLGQCTQPNSWNGFDLYVLHITNRNIPGPKPVFWYDAGIHSREIGTPELAMRYIDLLLNGYGNNPDSTWMVDYQDIWVMPTLNPDGHHMVESGGNSPTSHRKNADRDDGCSTYDQFGTDINRNFPFLWGCCGGSSTSPCSDIYRGPTEGSEEETQAMIAKVRELIPDQRGPNNTDPAPITTTGNLINMHSNAALNLYPWGWTSAFAPNRNDLRNIGQHMSAINAGGNGYQACQNTECLYIVDGDEKNWAYGELGIPSYSLEISGGSFFPPYTQIDSIWNENRGALVYMGKIARTPYLLTHGPDANTVATNPTTVNQGTPSQLTASINYAWTGNAYNQNAAAAEYYVDTPPWAGGTAIAMNGNFNSPTVAADASISTGSLSVGRHIIFVRGRGINDYEGLQSWGPISAAFLDILPAGSNSPTPTNTPALPTNTPTNTPVVTATPTTAAATLTPTPCAMSFTDVLPTDYFYEDVRWLYCRGAISGYSDNTFRPYNTATRGQFAKIIILAVGVPIYTPPTPTFQDVPANHTFYQYIETAYQQGIISGYSCGTGCLEFRPGGSVTRAQITKIVVGARGFPLYTPPTPTFRDVPADHPFYTFIETAYHYGVISGYNCGPGCLEFGPDRTGTRAQLSKIVHLALTAP